MKIERNYLIWIAVGAIFLLILTYLLITSVFTKPPVPPAPVETATVEPENVSTPPLPSIPHGNGIPTYSEIEADVKKEKARHEMVKELMADREKRMAIVCAEAHQRAQNESKDIDISKGPDAPKRPSPTATSVRWRRADPNPTAVNDVTKKGFFVR